MKSNMSPRFSNARRRIFLPCLLTIAVLAVLKSSSADDDAASPASPEKMLVDKVIAAAGGDDKLLTLFRMEERYSSGGEFVPPGTARVSVVEPPKSWWIGTKERGTEPAKITTWAWTLGVLKDPQSKLELLPDMTDNEKSLTGLRITGSVDPAIDMFFDKETHELARVDWRNDIYRFSDWKDFDGTRYPAKCAMFRRNTGKPWFFHEIVSIERLKELPEGLQR
jgi:hypothetical protein